MRRTGLTITAGNPLRLPADGSFFVQDEASQLVAVAAGARPGERVLDLCASPGGKTVAMAADMTDRGLARRLRRAREAHEPAARHRARERRAHASASSRVPASGALPFAPVVRPRARRRPVLGPRHHPARSRHPVAAARARPRGAGRRPARAARTRGRRSFAPAGVSSTRPARASRKRTRASSTPFSSRQPEFALVDLRGEAPAAPAAAARRPRHDANAAVAHGLEAFFAAMLRATS